MPLPRPPRYPLRSQDTHISPDLIHSHKTSVSSRSRMLDTNSQITMPSLADPATHGVSDYYHNDRFLFDASPFIDQKTFLEWHDFDDTDMFYQDPNQTGPALNYSDSPFQNVNENSTPNQLAEPTLWDYATSYNPTAQPYSSSTCPRSLLCGHDMLQDDPIPVRQIRSRPYAAESEHPKFTSNFAQQRRLRMPPAYTRRGLPSVTACGKTQQILSTEPKLLTLPTTKLEILAVSSPEMDKGCEDEVSLLNANDAESNVDPTENAEPYAQLIYRALKETPGHGMVLKDIYDWFEKNTDKAKNPLSKGWQNSIRHNLSMNGAFKKVERPLTNEESKKGYIWVLETSALEEGVKSTTRYRKHHFNKSICKPESPAPQRQLSGAKGGKAARKVGKVRRFTRSEGSRASRYRGALPVSTSTDAIVDEQSPKTTDNNFFASDGVPYYLHNSNALQAPTSIFTPSFNRPDSPISPLISNSSPYEFSSIIACSSAAPNDPLFYEVLE